MERCGNCRIRLEIVIHATDCSMKANRVLTGGVESVVKGGLSRSSHALEVGDWNLSTLVNTMRVLRLTP